MKGVVDKPYGVAGKTTEFEILYKWLVSPRTPLLYPTFVVL
jgi:hypothetical protein